MYRFKKIEIYQMERIEMYRFKKIEIYQMERIEIYQLEKDRNVSI